MKLEKQIYIDSTYLQKKISAKIVGGKDAQPHAYPHQVALLMKRNGQEGYSFCGGVLISKSKGQLLMILLILLFFIIAENYVLTAVTLPTNRT